VARGQKIVNVVLDEDSLVRLSAEAAHERAVAIYDLLEDNTFKLKNGAKGPYVLRLSLEDNRLRLDVRNEAGEGVLEFTLPMTSFRQVVRDYFTVCDSYLAAIKTQSPSKIEAIDVGRRSLHNEGSELLRERLAAYVEVDHQTARRLFTLLCALHIRRM
jgi:uncharacterized protein (UPF0262 family)